MISVNAAFKNGSDMMTETAQQITNKYSNTQRQNRKQTTKFRSIYQNESERFQGKKEGNWLHYTDELATDDLENGQKMMQFPEMNDEMTVDER